jgi:hypothetical protein
MLDNWINPLPSKSFLENQITRNQSCFSQNTSFKTDNVFSHIAIIGAGEATRMIRSAFYNLDFSPFSKLNITDLGDVRNNDPSLMTAAYKELVSQGILPIVFDASPNTSIAISNALKALEIENNQGIVSPRTDINFRTFGLLGDLLEEEKVNRLSIIGYQKHYANPSVQRIPHLDRAGLMSLGKLRDNFAEVEPIFRDLTALHLDMSIVRSSDSNGLKNQSSIGLCSEEVCKLMSYACSSSKMKAVHISGFEFDNKPEMAAELIAFIMWYAISGRQNAEKHPDSTSGMDKYVVELSTLDEKIQFWKNQNSERWWVEIPSIDLDNSLIPCSKKEYEMACNDKISDRLFLLLSTR